MSVQKKLFLFSAALLVLPAALILVLCRILYYRSESLTTSSNLEISSRSLMRIIMENYSIFLAVFAVISIILIIAMGIFFLRGILKPLKKLQKAAWEIERGNLDCIIAYDQDDEFKMLFIQFDRMRMRLKDLLWQQVQQEKTRTELIASIVHDLKTPITSIQGYSQALLDGVAFTKEKEEKYLTTIMTKAGDLNRMADTLHSFSKFELNQMNLEMERIPVYFVSETLASEDIILHANLEFELDNQTSHDSYIYADIGQIRRIFGNIIQNSIKYKKHDTAKIWFSASENDTDVLFMFEDNGIGVAEEQLDKIFDRFYRSDEARQNTGNGSGLGLSICQQSVKAMGGQIWARQNEHGGLTIFLSFPKQTGEST